MHDDLSKHLSHVRTSCITGGRGVTPTTDKGTTLSNPTPPPPPPVLAVAAAAAEVASGAGVVGGTFELAGGGVDSTVAEVSLDAIGAGAVGVAGGFPFISKSALKQEKFWQENLAGEL